MKNLSLALNAVLLLAVAVLYYLHFSSPSTKKSAETANVKDLKIAYINSDTILKYYDFFKVSREKLETKGKRLEQDLKNRAQGFQGDYEAYQRNANNLTPNQLRAVQEDLDKKNQNLQLYQQSLTQELQVDQEKLTTELRSRIQAYLAQYGRENGIQVVFKYDVTSDLLYGGDSLDISKVIIKGLNETYQSEQGQSTEKKDSVASKKK